MRWPWQHDIVVDPKAEEALAAAEAKLEKQQARQPQVDRITARLVERRQQNRFAELVEHALQAKRGQT